MVNIRLRSGTNQLHGAAWEFLRNDKLDARNFFATSQLGFQRNQSGVQLGGPIIKDKMFIFGSIQRSSIREELPFISTVPTQLMHSGNFSEMSPDPNIPNPFVPGTFYGDTIPAGSINSVGQNIVNLFPLPNISGAGLTNNFIF